MEDHIEQIIYDILEQDIPVLHDVTDIILGDTSSEIVLVAGKQGVVAGTDILKRMYEIIDDSVVVKVINGNGSKVDEDTIIAIISGKSVSIEKGLPTAITLLQHLCGVATYIQTCKSQLINSNITLYGPTKLTPLFQPMEELAIEYAGGRIYAKDFLGRVTISSIHINKCGGVTPALKILENVVDHNVKVTIEVSTFSEFIEAIQSDCDMIIISHHHLEETLRCLRQTRYDTMILVRGYVSMEDIQQLSGFPIDGIQPIPVQIPLMDVTYKRTS